MGNQLNKLDKNDYLSDAIKAEDKFIRHALTKYDKRDIREHIVDNFIEKGYTEDILTDDFLNYEIYCCIRYSKIQNSPHMNELYLPDYRDKINDIIKNTNIYEVWNCRDDDDEGEQYIKNKLLYIGDFISSKNFVKNWLSKNKKKRYEYALYYDGIYFMKNKKRVFHIFDNDIDNSNSDYEEHISDEAYDLILYNKEWFEKWRTDT